MVAYGGKMEIRPERHVELREALLTGDDVGIPRYIRVWSTLALYEIHNPGQLGMPEMEEFVLAIVGTVRAALEIDEEATVITLGRWAAEETKRLMEGEGT